MEWELAQDSALKEKRHHIKGIKYRNCREDERDRERDRARQSVRDSARERESERERERERESEIGRDSEKARER